MKIGSAILACLALNGCASTPENDAKWQAFAAALAGAGAAYNAGYNSVQPYQPVNTDYQFDWDQQYNAYYQLVWVCRGVQTGRYADLWRCNGLAQSDWRWPAK